MVLEDEQVERLGVYFTHFNIYEQFGLTFENYLERYSKNPSECSVEKLRREASIKGILRRTKNKKNCNDRHRYSLIIRKQALS